MMGEKVLVLGMGLSGRSAAKFLLSKGVTVFGFDQNQTLLNENEEIASMRLKGLVTLSLDDYVDMSQFIQVIVSPGISIENHLYAEAKQLGIEIIGEIELGLRHLQNPCIGITGTNGKTTVTLLVTHILNFSGTKAIAVGNVGNPLTSYLLNNHDEKDVLVIELSSYQIETLTSKVFDVGVILNITPDHLDRYNGMDDYAACKIKLEHFMKLENFYVNEKCYHEFKSFFQTPQVKLFGYGSLCDVRTDLESVYLKESLEYKLPVDLKGFLSHDIENMMAAYTITKVYHVKPKTFLDAYLGFKKPPHRIEFVRELDFVTYYDDSKGTNIDAVTNAVVSLKNPLYLIAGGVDKGASYEPWKKAFEGKVKGVAAIGQAAKKIQNDLAPEIKVEIFETLESAVTHVANLAAPGESVLLSPGCSSFDMFKDYKERGNEFKKIVNLLGGKG